MCAWKRNGGDGVMVNVCGMAGGGVVYMVGVVVGCDGL